MALGLDRYSERNLGELVEKAVNKSVCFFGREALSRGDIEIIELFDESNRQEVTAGIERFLASGNGSAIIVPDEDPCSLDDANEQIRKLYKNAYLAFNQLQPNPMIPDYSPVAGMLFDRETFIVPDITTTTYFNLMEMGYPSRMLCLDMGPFYPHFHTNYAEHPMLIMTWQHSLDQYQEEDQHYNDHFLLLTQRAITKKQIKGEKAGCPFHNFRTLEF